MPKKQSGLTRRGKSNVYQFEIRIPADLAEFNDGKRSYRVSLGTRDYREASAKAARLSAHWQTLFVEQRTQLEAREPIESVTPAMARDFAQQMLHDTLDGEDIRMRHNDRRLHMRVHAGLGVVGMQEAAQRLGMTMDATTPGAREATMVYLDQLKATLLTPGHVEQPPAPTLTKPQKAYKLRDVFIQWKASVGAGLKVGSVRAKELALEDFEAFSGNPPISEITRAQGEGFKAHLMAKGLASKTKHQRITDVKTLLKYAYHNLEWLPRQPWHGLDIDYKTETPRYPWTPEQLQGLFSLPLFQRYELSHLSKAGQDAAYWIPLLGLFTGARSGELCQLRVADIKEVGGHWLMDINEVNEGQDSSVKTIKTQASIRVVPIHSELMRLGFIDYANAIREAGNSLLWPKLPILIKDKPSHGFSWWFNNYPRNAVDGLKLRDFHSFRHTVRTLLMEANHPEKVQDRITGHETTGNSGKRTYAHVSTPRLVEAVESISYPFLALPRVYEPAKAIEAAQAG